VGGCSKYLCRHSFFYNCCTTAANLENVKPLQSKEPVKKKYPTEKQRPDDECLLNDICSNANRVWPIGTVTDKGAIGTESSRKRAAQLPSTETEVFSSKTLHKLSLKKRSASNTSTFTSISTTSSGHLPPAKKQCAHRDDPYLSQSIPSREETSSLRPSQSPDGFTLPQPQLVGTPTPTASLPVTAAQNSASNSELKKKVRCSRVSSRKW